MRAALSADFYRSVSTPSSPLPFPFLSLLALSTRGWLDNGARERSAAGAAEVPAGEAGHCRRCVLLRHTFLLFSVGIAARRAAPAPARGGWAAASGRSAGAAVAGPPPRGLAPALRGRDFGGPRLCVWGCRYWQIRILYVAVAAFVF